MPRAGSTRQQIPTSPSAPPIHEPVSGSGSAGGFGGCSGLSDAHGRKPSPAATHEMLVALGRLGELRQVVGDPYNKCNAAQRVGYQVKVVSEEASGATATGEGEGSSLVQLPLLTDNTL